MVSKFQVGKVPISEMNQKVLSDIPGLNYYSDFLDEDRYNQILNVLLSLDYRLVNGRPTKYFGLDYTHRKKVHNKVGEVIPPFFNLLDILDIEPDQLVIEWYKDRSGHHPIRESDLFEGNIIIVTLGSYFSYRLIDEDNNYIDLLMEPKSLLLISGESRKWKRCIRPRLVDKIGDYNILREEYFTLTFRNIK